MDNDRSREIESNLDILKGQVSIMERLLDESEGGTEPDSEKEEPTVRAISILISALPGELEGLTNRVRKVCERFTGSFLSVAGEGVKPGKMIEVDRPGTVISEPS